MGGVGVFFFGLMLTVANPFWKCVDALATGCAALERPALQPGRRARQ